MRHIVLHRLMKFVHQHQQPLMAIGIIGLVYGGVMALRSTRAFVQLELRSYDAMVRQRGKLSPEPDVVLVTISEDDIQRKRRWPWSDRMFGQLVTIISQGKPAVIGIDKYLDLEQPPEDVGGRSALVAAIAAAKNVVNVTFIAAQSGARSVVPPDDLKGISSFGFANMVTDEGNVVRRAVLLADDSASFAYELADRFLRSRGHAGLTFDRDTITLRAGDQIVPRFTPTYGGYQDEDASGYQIMINYRGPANFFKTVSAADLLDEKIKDDDLRKIFGDRLVLIGATAVSVRDDHTTPFSTGAEVTYGVEIHGHIASQLIRAALNDQPLIHVIPNWAEWLWILCWSILGGMTAFRLRQSAMNLTALLLLTALLYLFVYTQLMQGLWLPLIAPLLGLVAANIMTVAYLLSLEQAERKILMGLFSRHVSKELVSIIWSSRQKFLEDGRIQGQDVYVTVLFTDMRNFSTAAEAQAPNETMNWLNHYLSLIADEILRHGGMVDKYIGDAVMAVFGVPIPHRSPDQQQRDACNAVRAAVTIAQKLQQLNETYIARGLPPVVTGIGINSGWAIAGSLGSDERMEYSVLGDTVNIASRLEGLNKQIDGGPYHILVSEATHQHLSDNFKTEFVDSVRLKGKQLETPVYRVLDCHATAIEVPGQPAENYPPAA